MEGRTGGGERWRECGTVCYLSPWHVPCPAEPLLPLCLCPPSCLSTLFSSLFCLSVRSPCGAAHWNSSYHLPELYRALFRHVLPHSLSLVSASVFIPLASGNSFLLPPYSFTLAKPVGKPPSPLSLSILMVSKRPRGISDSLTDCPQLHPKLGSISPLHFGNSHPISTFANFTHTDNRRGSLIHSWYFQTGMCYCDMSSWGV